MTGSMPGIAASTSETCVLGSPPKAVEAPENSLERDVTWACTSRPTITSQSPVAPLMSLECCACADMVSSFQSPRPWLMPHDDTIKGAVVSPQRPNCSKPRQANPSKNPWICLVLFVRIGTFQWVAAIPNKKFSPPPSPRRQAPRKAREPTIWPGYHDFWFSQRNCFAIDRRDAEAGLSPPCVRQARSACGLFDRLP